MSDWFYIIGVIVVFIAFLLWNKNRNAKIKERSKNRSFKRRYSDRRDKK